VTASRPFVSPRRQAQAAATREAILEAFADQLSERGRDTLSPLDAARHAGVSVRTVHLYFPNLESQMQALGEWYDRQLSLDGVAMAQGPDDLPRYFRDIHAVALNSPHRAVAVALLQWPEVRQPRRAPRLDAIRRSVAAVGAPTMPTKDATTVLLSLSGLDASWSMHVLYGLPIERIPDAIANTVRLVVEDLRTQVQDNHERNTGKSSPNRVSRTRQKVSG
jgi:AcrR family transcriptional regulator